mmetsp:Transcript_39947/g.97977  ORF Transcript_39947/g.97977 Transcript_39947/m.97977 type:complete len:200 (+) Transcript_39947:1507-2106(+)
MLCGKTGSGSSRTKILSTLASTCGSSLLSSAMSNRPSCTVREMLALTVDTRPLLPATRNRPGSSSHFDRSTSAVASSTNGTVDKRPASRSDASSFCKSAPNTGACAAICSPTQITSLPPIDGVPSTLGENVNFWSDVECATVDAAPASPRVLLVCAMLSSLSAGVCSVCVWPAGAPALASFGSPSLLSAESGFRRTCCL